MTTFYLAGPMSGLPQFNVPAFDNATAALRAAGHTIISPAELDSPAMRAYALESLDGAVQPDGKIAGESWGDLLARDVRVIHGQADGIIFLPNWYASRGARLEAFVALLTGKTQFGFYQGFIADGIDLVRWVDKELIRNALRQNMP